VLALLIEGICFIGGREPIGKNWGFEDDIVRLLNFAGVERGFILGRQRKR